MPIFGGPCAVDEHSFADCRCPERQPQTGGQNTASKIGDQFIEALPVTVDERYRTPCGAQCNLDQFFVTCVRG